MSQHGVIVSIRLQLEFHLDIYKTELAFSSIRRLIKKLNYKNLQVIAVKYEKKNQWNFSF